MTAPSPSRVRPLGNPAFLAAVCLVASLGGLLFGFDTAVISGTVERVKQQYGLSDLLEGWFTSSALVGCILGAAVAGMLGDRFGRKPTLLAASVFFFVSALYSTIPPTFTVLVIARWVGGLGVGMASVLAPLYISEFAPPRHRGRLGALYQLSIVIGILLAYLSNWLILRLGQDHPMAFGGQGWGHKIFVAECWRAMFGAEMVPCVIFFGLLLFMPESPRWLLKAGKEAQGLALLTRVSGPTVAQRELAEIQAGLAREEGSVRELFRPGLRIALLVGVMLSVFGQLSGVNIVVYYGPKILATAGYADAAALLGQVGFGIINLVFTIFALLVIDRWGRRPLLIGGMAVVTVALVVLGGLFLWGASPAGPGEALVVSRAVGLWIGLVICVYMACIALSICAVIWVLTPEIFPNRVRGRAASIATFANWSTNALSAQLFPWYSAQLGMHSAFFTAAAICSVATVFFWKFVPETKGRSLEEIERHWRRQ
ncbi:MAG: sugar porter family MFS transporter [Verrucomicrobia bacterium]|nr:sugar porter family MFS transporter [Verrucomicrobiota bacterium]